MTTEHWVGFQPYYERRREISAARKAERQAREVRTAARKARNAAREAAQWARAEAARRAKRTKEKRRAIAAARAQRRDEAIVMAVALVLVRRAVVKEAKRREKIAHAAGHAARVAQWAHWRPGRRRGAKARARHKAKRERVLRQATPPWANRFYIEEIYQLARLRTRVTGIEWHVDHIIPLNNPSVCGLHVETNLQVITAEENIRKSNSYPPLDT